LEPIDLVTVQHRADWMSMVTAGQQAIRHDST
jgi:hypothetical protein